ncbi:MAG: DUF4347 domain-containing protein, partial [Telluria sp.]
MTATAFDPANDDLIIATPRKEIVFIEDNVADIDTLIKGIGSGKEVVILDSSVDGLHQIAQALAGRSGVDALHIVSHGSAGTIGLGTLLLDAANMGAHNDDLQAIGRSMSADGDVLLYGCDIGAGSGAGFVQQLAIATGADVAASSNPTGSTALGGDWNLEVTSGAVGTAVVVDAHTAALYQQVLNITTANVDFNTPTNFVATSFNTLDPATNAIYKVNGNPAYQLVIDGENEGTSAYFDGSAGANPYVSAAGYGEDNSITINFAAGQIFTASSISIANFDSNSAVQDMVIKGYDAWGHQVGSTATKSLGYGQANYVPIPIALSGMTNIVSLKITATSNNGKIHYLIIDNLALANIQPAPPKVNYVTSANNDGTYKIGDHINISVVFDSAVDVTGTPQLTLETGTTDRVINYASGSGTSTLIFGYTVQAGDLATDLNYLSNTTIALNGGSIKMHGGSINADLTLPASNGPESLGGGKEINVDGIAPTLAITSDHAALKVGETAAITFTFSENPGASFSAGDLTVSGGTLSGLSGSGLTRTATFTPAAGTDNGTASISVNAGAFADAAGNTNTATSNSPTITYDTLRPTVAITSDQAALKAGETATIT